VWTGCNSFEALVMGRIVVADSFLGLDLPFGGILLPLVAGLVAGGLAILVFNYFGRGSSVALPPPPKVEEKKGPDYDPFLHGSATEQRRALRRGGNPIEVLITTAKSKHTPIHGWVLDRSVGGLCLSVGQEIQVGAQLDVLPVNAPPMTPWVEIEVRSCRPGPEGFQVGCQFVKSPPWGVLLQFG
jgi:hypothetical protein